MFIATACARRLAPPSLRRAAAGPGGSYEQFKLDATLLAAAKAEGTLTTIAAARWCNYGQIEGAAANPNNVIDTFKARTELKVNELSPLAGSGDEIEAIKTNKDNKGPQAPDVVDIGLSFGPSGKAEGLFAPYKVATWDTIPVDVKDPDGAGTATTTASSRSRSTRRSFPTFRRTGPTCSRTSTKANRLRRRSLSSQAGHPVRLRLGPRQRRLARRRHEGPRLLQAAQGQGQPDPGRHRIRDDRRQQRDPITIRWTYNALAGRDAHRRGWAEDRGRRSDQWPVQRRVRPGDQRLRPAPERRQAWEEFLYSDEGQNMWLRGYCHPIRYRIWSRTTRSPRTSWPNCRTTAPCSRRWPSSTRPQAHHRAVGFGRGDRYRRPRRSERPGNHRSRPQIHGPDRWLMDDRSQAGCASGALLAVFLGWVGLLPFFVFSFLFIILPTFYLVTGSSRRVTSPRCRTT